MTFQFHASLSLTLSQSQVSVHVIVALQVSSSCVNGDVFTCMEVPISFSGDSFLLLCTMYILLYTLYIKVGTLIGDEEDVERRKRLSNAALTKLLYVWIKGDKIKRKTKLKLYRSLVKSILVYNCGTWALTKSEEEKLNAFHRKQLRKVLNIKYPVKITNSSLYNKCEEHPLSIYILENRWRLFGHILRRNIEIPANKSMNSYFATHGKKFRGRPLTTLPVVLNKDLSRLQENTLQLTTREDLEHLRCIAQNRQQWRELSTRIRKAAEAPPSDD